MLPIVGLKSPDLLATFIEITPPTQAHQQPPRDILDHPEIDGPQHGDQYEGGDQTEEEPKEEVSAHL